MTRDATDPDVGKIERQDTFIPDYEWDDQRDTIRQALKGRLWPEGETFTCPECHEPSFQGRSDLTHRVTRGPQVISIRHLHGAHCTNCEATTLKAYEQIQIEDEIGIGFHPDYEAKVSRIGSGTLGTYWPKDVQRVLNLEPHKKAYIEIIDQDAVLIRFKDVEEASA